MKLKIDKKIRNAAILLMLITLSFLLIYRYSFVFMSSDYPAHIRQALRGEGYSLVSFLIRTGNKLFASNVPFVFIMSLITAASAIVAAFYMKKVMNCSDISISAADLIPLAVSSLFLCKLCIPEWSGFFYSESFVSQPWHNSTYTAMRLFATMLMFIFISMERRYQKKIDLKQCIIFVILLILTNMCKPNFVIVFAPVLLIVFIIDFIRSRTKTFRNAFLFGICVLIACFVLIYQYKVSFPAEGDSGIEFSVSHAVSFVFKDMKMPLYFVLNYAFPLSVTYHVLRNWKQMKREENRYFLEIWSMVFFAIFVSLFIQETGPRAADGNFGWGVPYFSYLLFVTCIPYLEILKDRKLISSEKYTLNKYLYYLHVIFGIFYFGLLIMGYLSWGI